jgi:DNA-binding NarL/FixJ family response regulator
MTAAPTDMSLPIRVLVVDDHPLLLEGLACVIDADPRMQVVARALDGQHAIDEFRVHRPDVTLMDIQMPGMDGFVTTVALRGEFPDARILILSTYDGDAQARRALEAGARGYLLKSMCNQDLVTAILEVHTGKRFIPPEVAMRLADHVTDEPLTQREVDVLRCVAEGNSNRGIADRLCVSEDTIKTRLKNIMSKLAAKDRTHAVMIALRRGIIDKP